MYNITTEFYVIYYNILHTKDENAYIKNLGKLINESSDNLIEFSKINNIKKLIFHLEENNLLIAHKISLLNYVKIDIFIKLLKLKSDSQINAILESNVKLFEKIILIQDNLCNKLNYINAFNEFSSNINDNSFLNDSDNIVTNNSNKHLVIWCTDTKQELINRLILLTENYENSFLSTINIKFITYNDVKNMSFNLLVKYYNKTVKSIKTYLKKYIKLCNAYVEIEKTYILTLITLKTTISLDNFDLVLENIDDEEID